MFSPTRFTIAQFSNSQLKSETLKLTKALFQKNSLYPKIILDYALSLPTMKIKLDWFNKFKIYAHRVLKNYPDLNNDNKFIHAFNCIFLKSEFYMDNQKNILSQLNHVIDHLSQINHLHTSFPINKNYKSLKSTFFMKLLEKVFININPKSQKKLLKKFILHPNVDLNEKNNHWGNTILHWWISNGNSHSCMIFISLLKQIAPNDLGKLDLNTLAREFGTSLLHLTTAKGYRSVDFNGQPIYSYLELAKCLIKNGACVNLKTADHLGYITVENGHVQIKHYLHPCAQTPLHIACAKKDFEMMALLIKHNADITLKNGLGLTPFDVFNLPEDRRREIVNQVSGICLSSKRGLNDFDTQSIRAKYRKFHEKCLKLINSSLKDNKREQKCSKLNFTPSPSLGSRKLI